MHMKNRKNAFTLVELIIVIVILAILSTIWFISFQSYIKDARNTNRIQNLSLISNSIDLFSIKSTRLPIPKDRVDLYLSWKLIWYQWVLTNEHFQIFNMTNVTDPLDRSNYLYYTDKKKWQVLWYLEWKDLYYLNSTKYNWRYPISRWNALGILLKRSDLRTPLNYTYSWVLHVDSWSTIREQFLPFNFWANNNGNHCSEWFIEVPWNPLYVWSSFCVMKYEAKIKWQNDWEYLFNNFSSNPSLFDIAIPESRASWTPWVQIKQVDAIEKCQKLWKNYHLLTNNEWMAIAWNIESNVENWTSKTYWRWEIYSWNNDTEPWKALSWSENDNDGYFNTLDSFSTKFDQKRTLELPNWSIIWDFAWNVREMTSDTIETLKVPNSANGLDDIREYSNNPPNENANISYQLEYINDINSWNISPSWFNSVNGIGWYYYYEDTNAKKSVSCLSYDKDDCSLTSNISWYIRWWSVKSTYISWLYALTFSYSPEVHNKAIWFRCAK